MRLYTLQKKMEITIQCLGFRVGRRERKTKWKSKWLKRYIGF